jgi:hypothetical protein
MAAAEEKRVAPLELFFDLVFVFAITQVTALMSHDPHWDGLARGMLVLAVLWWAWAAYGWLTNYIAAEEDRERLLMLAVMGAFLIAALATPEASATARSCSRSPTRRRGGSTSSSSWRPTRTSTPVRPSGGSRGRRYPRRCC